MRLCHGVVHGGVCDGRDCVMEWRMVECVMGVTVLWSGAWWSV